MALLTVGMVAPPLSKHASTEAAGAAVDEEELPVVLPLPAAEDLAVFRGLQFGEERI